MDKRMLLLVVLAGLALVGVLGWLSVSSFTAADPTEASNFILGKITTGSFNPIVAPVPVSGTFTATASPNRPGEIATYTLTFGVPGDLANGVDEIIITWDEDFKNFPTTISNSAYLSGR